MKRLHEILNPSLTDDVVKETIVEVLTKDSTAKDWIDDFIKSDAPQFKGKDKEERIKMALGAYYAAQRNEDIETLEDVIAEAVDKNAVREKITSLKNEMKSISDKKSAPGYNDDYDPQARNYHNSRLKEIRAEINKLRKKLLGEEVQLDKEEYIKMALGAYYAAQRNEDITFDELSVVDPTDGSYPEDEEDIIARQYIKRKRGIIGEESSDDLQEEILGEALTMMQRVKRRAIMRKNKGKIALGRKRAGMRRASNAVLKARSMRAARNILFKKLLRKDKADASYGEKVRAEKVLATRRGAIERIARKLLPAMRKKEMEKFSKKNES